MRAIPSQALTLDQLAEDVLAKDLVVGDGEVGRAKGRGPVRAPLGCEHVLLTDSGHALVLFLPVRDSAAEARVGEQAAWESGRFKL